MKKLLTALSALFILAACHQESPLVPEMESVFPGHTTAAADFRGNKISICHNGRIIKVNENAVEAHRGHGDAVDMDSDGYYDIDCVCGELDCDDLNAAIYLGAPEICDNGIDDDCDGLTDCEDSDCGNDDNCNSSAEDLSCCFATAISELNFTCWNGDIENPVLWDEQPSYGLCSSCLEGGCGFRTPELGYVRSSRAASDECRQLLVRMAQTLGLGIGPLCDPGEGAGSGSGELELNNLREDVFGQ